MNRHLQPYQPAETTDTSLPRPLQTVSPETGSAVLSRMEWCEKASKHRQGIAEAKDTIARAYKRIKELDSNPSSPTHIKDRFEPERQYWYARKQWIAEQQALSELEKKAWQEGIPREWLQCRFEQRKQDR